MADLRCHSLSLCVRVCVAMDVCWVVADEPVLSRLHAKSAGLQRASWNSSGNSRSTSRRGSVSRRHDTAAAALSSPSGSPSSPGSQHYARVLQSAAREAANLPTDTEDYSIELSKRFRSMLRLPRQPLSAASVAGAMRGSLVSLDGPLNASSASGTAASYSASASGSAASLGADNLWASQPQLASAGAQPRGRRVLAPSRSVPALQRGSRSRRGARRGRGPQVQRSRGGWTGGSVVLPSAGAGSGAGAGASSIDASLVDRSSLARETGGSVGPACADDDAAHGSSPTGAAFAFVEPLTQPLGRRPSSASTTSLSTWASQSNYSVGPTRRWPKQRAQPLRVYETKRAVKHMTLTGAPAARGTRPHTAAVLARK